MTTTNSPPNNAAMSPPPTGAEKVAAKKTEAKDREVKADEVKAYEAMYAEVMERWARSQETVKRALAQGEECMLKEYPQFEGVPVLDEPYAYAMWKIYERDGSN